jgi:hypothetical protein
MTVSVESRLGVRGVEDFWARCTGRAPNRPVEMADRLMLDTLGLGIEQAMTHLFQSRPELGDFENWVLEAAGTPDPETVARYHAWLDGVPPPEATQRRLAAIDAAAPVLDAADMGHWDREGWVILRAAISPEQAAATAALLWQVAGATPDDPASWQGERQQGMMVQHFQGEPLEAARRSPRVHTAFAQLWGTADLWTRIDRLSFNAPLAGNRSFRAPRLHWDVSLAPPVSFQTQAVLYLTDTAANQGALELVPGFHHRIHDWLETLGDQDPREVDLSAQAITIPASAGDLVIWRDELPHGASPNRAALPRLAQYVTMYSPDMQANPVWR